MIVLWVFLTAEDAELRSIYEHTIKGLEANLYELPQFYSLTPRTENVINTRDEDSGLFSGNLLGFSKAAVRNYAIAITERATPVLIETLNKQLQKAIETHWMIFSHSIKRTISCI